MSLLLSGQHPVPRQRRALPQMVSPFFDCDGPSDREMYSLSGMFYPNTIPNTSDTTVRIVIGIRWLTQCHAS